MDQTTERAYVVECYRRHFMGQEGIVLYGVGVNTKAILTQTDDPNIIGLMDPVCEGSTVMGKPVLSLHEAAERAKVVVIIARTSVVPIIFARIRELETVHRIPVCNIEGIRLIEKENDSVKLSPFLDDPYWDLSGGALRDAIAAADVISFDIFDTLLVRDVLRPVDLFPLLERRLQQEGIPCPDFHVRRRAAGMQLEQDCVPTLAKIYGLLAQWYAWPEELAQRACGLEFELEQRACHARQWMQALYESVMGTGKPIILISDMYLREEQIRSLLERSGYRGWSRLYVSCEHQAAKASGALYEVVQRDFVGKRILHIGDNAVTDGDIARSHGFSTYPVRSVYDMLLHSSLRPLAVKADTPEKLLALGILTRVLFDDPYALGPTKGTVLVDDLFQMGASLIGPVVSCFLRWMCQEVRDGPWDMILFGARDGYLIEQLYRDRWPSAQGHLPKGVYFKTSRRAVTIPAIRGEEDISEILLRPYHTTKGELLLARFGVSAPPDDIEASERADSVQDPGSSHRYILRHRDAILQNAAVERENYRCYLDHLGLTSAKRVLLYDFCSRGTVQHYLSKLLGPDIQIAGMYFATMDWFSMPYHQQQQVKTFLGNTFPYCPGSYTAEHFMFLEAVLLEPCGSLICCHPDGTFQYAAYENEGHQNAIQAIQAGITAFDHAVRAWEDLLRPIGEGDRTFADEVFGMLFNGRCVLSQVVKESVIVDGAYDFERPHQILR